MNTSSHPFARKVEFRDVLALALEKLRGVAASCSPCSGSGELRETLAAHVLTDDPRLVSSHRAIWCRERVRRFGSQVEQKPIGAGVLVTPCGGCADVRQVIESLGGLL